MTVLVVAAHPDDEVLGCGGTMARLSSEGEEVHTLILGEGATSRADQGGRAGAAAVSDLRAMSTKAAEILGVTAVRHAGLPDNRFDSIDLLDIVRHVEQMVAELQPSAVYCQHGGDLNVDHVLTFRAVLTATRPMPGQTVEQVLAFEVGSSSEWAFQRFAPDFRPSVFVDISATLDRKLDALRAYEVEMRPSPHPRSYEAIESQARHRGATVGVHAAEAFDLVRWVR